MSCDQRSEQNILIITALEGGGPQQISQQEPQQRILQIFKVANMQHENQKLK